MSHTAVVILNYNGEKLLPRFLPSVLMHSTGAEVIVADNASTDNSVPWLRQHHPDVRIITLAENYGFCGGYNRALREVDADYYVLLNSDVEVTAGWLSPMTELLDRDAQVAAVQPKVLSYERRSQFEYAGAGGGYIDALGYPFCRGRLFDTVEEDQGQYNDTRDIFWATGACLMIRARDYHHFNGLDEDFFAHMEEIDLCWKLHRADKRVCYCGSSTVYHLGAGTLGYLSPRKTYLNFRNGLVLLLKHLNPAELLYKVPLRLLLDGAAAGLFLFKRQPAHTAAVFRAHMHGVKTLKSTWQKRRSLRQQYPDYHRMDIFPGILVYRYYMLGQKLFSALRWR